ncbi:MAG: LLM class flavin-dependent oxidoreductase, partial [Acidimicrobiia bacterium]
AERIQPVSHAGDHFQVEGQLFMHRSPQGRPVIVQAGQSTAGLEFAARNAEVVFTAQRTLVEAKEFYDELKGRAESAGRNPSSVRILPGIMPLVADSVADLEALEERLDSYLPIDDVRALVASKLQTDLSGLAADEPIPPDRLKSPEDADVEIAFGSRYRNFYELAVNDRLTLRRVAALIERNLGHFAPRGTTAEVADELERWYEAGACDGFAFTPVSMPDALDSICDLLMPELRRRGLARESYDGVTLRDHLGLERPPSPVPATAGAYPGT